MYYCIYCMTEIPEQAKECCPYCTGSRSSYKSPEGMIEPESLFCGRYYMGRAYRSDSSGVSYIGYDTVMNRRVSVRQLVNFGDESYRKYEHKEKFLYTYKTLARIDISSLPAVYTCNIRDNIVYAVSEYTGGRPLGAYISDTGNKSYEAAKSLLLPVIVALKLMHEKNICHGNVKLVNIRKTDKTTVLCEASGIGGASGEKTFADDIRDFLRCFVSVLAGSPVMADEQTINDILLNNGAELPDEALECIRLAFEDNKTSVSADVILRAVYKCRDIAVGRKNDEPKAPPAELIKLAETSGVEIKSLTTSLV